MCIVTREVKDEAELIRFVRSPDGVAVPDLARKLPGRGVWVSLDRKMLAEAVAQEAVFARLRGGDHNPARSAGYGVETSPPAGPVAALARQEGGRGR